MVTKFRHFDGFLGPTCNHKDFGLRSARIADGAIENDDAKEQSSESHKPGPVRQQNLPRCRPIWVENGQSLLPLIYFVNCVWTKSQDLGLSVAQRRLIIGSGKLERGSSALNLLRRGNLVLRHVGFRN